MSRDAKRLWDLENECREISRYKLAQDSFYQMDAGSLKSLVLSKGHETATHLKAFFANFSYNGERK